MSQLFINLYTLHLYTRWFYCCPKESVADTACQVSVSWNDIMDVGTMCAEGAATAPKMRL